MKVIALSAGHSDKDPGAVHRGLVERDIVEQIVKDASDILRAHGVGVLNSPGSLNLPQTVRWINDRSMGIDVCCEIHVNSSAKANQGLGLEAWHYRDSEVSKKFGQFLIDAIAAESGMSKKRGVKDEKTANIWGRLGFVHNTIPLACLVECGFINTNKDREILLIRSGLYDLSKGVARGVLSYFGMKWKPSVSTKPVEGKEFLQLKKELAECQKECLRQKGVLDEIRGLLNI